MVDNKSQNRRIDTKHLPILQVTASLIHEIVPLNHSARPTLNLFILYAS